MTTLVGLFKLGIIIALIGLCILFGGIIYEAFQKSLEWGLEVTGSLIFIFGTALSSVIYITVLIDYFKKKGNRI